MPRRRITLFALGNLLAHRLDQVAHIVLVACKICREVATLRKTHAGTFRNQVDDFRFAILRADHPINLHGGIIRSRNGRCDDLGIGVWPHRADGNDHPLILAEVAGDFDYHHLVEAGQVLGALVGRGDLLKAAKAEAPQILNSHSVINDLLQPAALVFA
jgi:hypothetical protein